MSHFRFPTPVNEPVKSYAPGTHERADVTAQLAKTASEIAEIPVVVGSEQRFDRKVTNVVMPHAHAHVVARTRESNEQDVRDAIAIAMKVAPRWAAMPFVERASIFWKAAELAAGPWRQRINAACMLGQSKTVFQSEIDAVCELADFLRFGVHFAERLMDEQPISPAGTTNRLEYRALEGFVLAISPFNFSSLSVNLCTAPALMGNVVLWKPTTSASLAAWTCLEMLKEAGLPDGVIQFIPGEGPLQGRVALESEYLAGIHFTGSTNTFRSLWKGVAANLDHYRTFPRLVGETGGKDFIVAHPSADPAALATAIVRGGFEYQGQKCSAASRLYIPKSLLKNVSERVCADIDTIKMGDVRDFSNFMSAVIDERAFDRIAGYQELARSTGKILRGGGNNKSVGYFIEPTFVEVADPKHRLMAEEIFGPVVTAYVYDDAKWNETLDLVNTTSPYALTGAVFSQDREALVVAHDKLQHAAGNYYVNDKPTGAVVGQQPFGGARASGTNDKAGALWNMARWTSARTIKETFTPPTDYRYPFLG